MIFQLFFFGFLSFDGWGIENIDFSMVSHWFFDVLMAGRGVEISIFIVIYSFLNFWDRSNILIFIGFSVFINFGSKVLIFFRFYCLFKFVGSNILIFHWLLHVFKRFGIENTEF